jgi:shikimate dehydrogenase/3-dehydroquinate dehydratase type I
MSEAEPSRPAVVCSILERDRAATARRIREVPPGCDLVEIRGDDLCAGDVAGLVQGAGRHVVVTVRSTREDGHFAGSEEQRREILLAALAAGARFIDVEQGSPLEDLADGDEAGRVILSHHGAACCGDVLLELYRSMARRRAARLKIVPVARSPRDAAVVRDLLATARSDGRPLACFASGRAGAVTRLMAPAWGSWATYGAAACGAETAEGQFTARDMLEVYDVGGIGPATKRFVLIGSAVFASPSPAMHAAGYRDAGLDARYLPLEIDDIEESLPLLGPDGVLGAEAIAVTLPFKEAARARCDSVDEVAGASDAVNTVVVGPDGWSGFNTDGPAILSLVRSRLDPQGATVAVVGAGGTARAAAAVLDRAGARVTLYNRTVERVREVARALGIDGRSLADLADAPWDVLVQATPLGREGEVVVAADRLRGTLVLDAVYGHETPLVRDARRRGLATVDGFELLVAQAVLQFDRMTGARFREESLRQAGRSWLESRAT